jgi:type IV secretion system protein VirB6
MTNFAFFTLIYAWLSHKIDAFGDALMGRMVLWVAGVATVLVTLWIMLTGYRVITGQLREPLMAVVTHMARVVVILSAATTMSVFGANLNTFLTTDLSNEINQVVSGSHDSVYTTIDKNLAYTEVAMSAIDAIQTVPGNTDLANQKEHASFWAGFGTAGPPMTAAVMLLMYRFAMALFIGFGPLFILCLMFEQTKSLFNRWLLYGLGTLFSLAVLNVVAAMVLQLSIGVAAGMWTIDLISHFTPINTEGLSHQALEQGGIGLLLTMLIITIPPMAANFFQGTLGNFLHYSAFGSFGTPGPQGQPPGSYAQHNGQPAASPHTGEGKTSNNLHPSHFPNNTPSSTDSIKRPPTS